MKKRRIGRFVCNPRKAVASDGANICKTKNPPSCEEREKKCAHERNRTFTSLRMADFESAASTNSATWAYDYYFLLRTFLPLHILANVPILIGMRLPILPACRQVRHMGKKLILFWAAILLKLCYGMKIF